MLADVWEKVYSLHQIHPVSSTTTYYWTVTMSICQWCAFFINCFCSNVECKSSNDAIYQSPVEHKYINFNWENTKRNHVQFMYKLFVQDSMFISRLYLTESGRSASAPSISSRLVVKLVIFCYEKLLYPVMNMPIITCIYGCFDYLLKWKKRQQQNSNPYASSAC